jgi:hypothetical protein
MALSDRNERCFRLAARSVLTQKDARAAAIVGVDTNPSPEQELSHKDMQACIRATAAYQRQPNI